MPVSPIRQGRLTFGIRFASCCKMKTKNERLVAILQFVIEDSETRPEYLRLIGFPAEVLQSVDLLTHGESDSYEEYPAGIKPGTPACSVKFAGMHDNSHLDRIKSPAAKDDQRTEKYRKAIAFSQS